MKEKVSQAIANTIIRCISNVQPSQQHHRIFIRIEDFDTAVYQNILKHLRNRQKINDHHILVRSIRPIPGFEQYSLEPNRSATWYRNHLQPGYMLILIFNQRTSDAQSLKDLYTINPVTLATKELSELIDSGIQNYQYNNEEKESIVRFIQIQLRKAGIVPSLEHIVSFLIELDRLLVESYRLPEAIAYALPQLHLFRCSQLAQRLQTAGSSKLLREVYLASRIGMEVIDESKEKSYLSNLGTAHFSDQSAFGGFSPEVKMKLLQDFITGKLIDDPKRRQEVFQIDWEEVQQIIRPRKNRIDIEQIVCELEEAKTEHPDTNKDIEELIRQLQSGSEVDSQLVEDVLKAIGELLSPEVRAALRKLLRPRLTRNADFLNGLMHLLVELQDIYQSNLTKNCHICVKFVEPDRLDNTLIEAIQVFRYLYGGIDQVITNVTWDLNALWRLASLENTDGEEDDESQKVKRETREELTFQVVIRDSANDKSIGSAKLIWEYHSDSIQSITVKALEHEWKRIQAGYVRIPMYRVGQTTTKLLHIDLLRPITTLGAWYQNTTDIRNELNTLKLPDQTTLPIFQALNKLEQDWRNFIEQSQNGLFSSQIAHLSQSYQHLLQTMIRHASKSRYRSLFHIINQSWMIRQPSASSWAIMPLFHPIKLDWLLQRAQLFHELIQHMFYDDPPSIAVDYKIVQREISNVYSSSNVPPVVMYDRARGKNDWLLASAEAYGYELFVSLQQHDEATSFDYLGNADEQQVITDQVIDTVTNVIQDYIEIYPFAQDGLRILLLECRSSDLPIMLLKRVKATNSRQENSWRLHVVVHTSRYGATLFHQIDKWLEDTLSVQESLSYIPSITIDVLECPLDEVFKHVKSVDIVSIVDLFSQDTKNLSCRLTENNEELSDASWFTTPIRPDPLEEGQIYRRFQLTSKRKTSLMRLFLLSQYVGIAEPGDDLPNVQSDIQLFYNQSLEKWQDLLKQLHQTAHWVVCYDRVVDRFLLQATCDDAQIIRYALGLGKQRLYHLTVSSSGRTQQLVVQRLANRLHEMLPQVDYQRCQNIAKRLAHEANRVSGDIVLRAAGPGAFLNELIGLVATITKTEHLFQQQHPHALFLWLSLDNFKHWFPSGKTRKTPDLLLIGLANEDDRCIIHLQIVEAKCIQSNALTRERRDAQLQVRNGVNQLIRAFAPGAHHLDAPYWYDQLYRAIAGNLRIGDDQRSIWELVQRCLPVGDFQLVTSGHSWIFCYDAQVGDTNVIEQPFSSASEAPEVPLTEHLCGRNELFAVLGSLVNQAIIPDPFINESVDRGELSVKGDDVTIGVIPVAPKAAGDQYEPPSILPLEVADTPTPPLADNAARDQYESPSISPFVVADTLANPLNVDREWLNQKASEVEQALRRRGVQLYTINPADADIGPSIVRFKFRLKPNQQLKRLKAMIEDLARDLKLERPPFIDNVPGTDFVGIDIPRSSREVIDLQPLLSLLPEPKPAELPIIIGISPNGKLVIEDLAEFPHLLVAGTTKSGKSVFLRNVLISLLSVYRTGQIEFLIIDPKQTDFVQFTKLPFLRKGKVIVERRAAREALLELVHEEMPRRQRHIAHRSMKIKNFNQRYPAEALPPIVAIIDEYGLLTSLMNKKEREMFEQDLSALAAAARSVGIHLIIATQHPSAEVITPTIKANLDARIALRVASSIYSRVVLETQGAEHLLGHGDMLFRRPDGSIIRLQAPFIDEDKIPDLLRMIKARF
jgi:hypothetical protein